MAAAADTVTFSMEVELAKLNAQLATIPGTTKREAMAATAALKKSWDDATRAAKSTATQANAAITSVTKTATASAGAVKAGYVNLFNQLSDVGSQLTTGTSPMTILIQQGPQVAGALDLIGLSMSSLLTVVAPVGVAVAALGYAWMTLNDELEEAEKRNAAAAAASQRLADAVKAVREQQTQLADKLALAEHRVTEAQLQQRDATGEVVKQYGPLIEERQRSLTAAQAELVALNATIEAEKQRTGQDELRVDLAEELYGKRDRLVKQIDRESVELVNLATAQAVATNRVTSDIQATEAAIQADRDREEALRRLREAEERQAAEIAAIVEGYARYKRAVETLASMERAAETAQLDAIDSVRAAQADALEQAAQLRREGLIGAQADARRREAVEAQYAETVVAINEEATFKIDKLKADAAAKEAARQQKALKDAERLRAAQVAAAADVTRTVGGYLGDIAATSDGVYSRQVDTIGQLNAQLAQGEEYLTETQKAELNNRIRAQEKAARRAFEVGKALRIAQATANAYAAASQAFAEVPYPFNFAAGATALAAGMVNVAQISATEPAFHRGGMIDEQRITALSGEAVLSRQGVQALGGEQAVNRINSTGGSASAGPAVYAVSVYRHDRITERWQADGLRRGDPVSRAINAARTVPYGHRS